MYLGPGKSASDSGFQRLFNPLHLIQHFFTAFGTFDRFFLTVKGFQLGNDRLLMLNIPLLI